MLGLHTWNHWSRHGLQSNADLWLIAARTQVQLSECHGQALESLARNWPELGAWQPQVLPRVTAGFVERSVGYCLRLQSIVEHSQRALASTALRLNSSLDPTLVDEWLAKVPSPSRVATHLLLTTARAWGTPATAPAA